MVRLMLTVVARTVDLHKNLGGYKSSEVGELEAAVKVDEILANKESLTSLVAFSQTIEANLMVINDNC